MSERRDIIEWLNIHFERLGVWSYDHRALVLAGCAALLGFSLWGASGVRFDNSFEAYFDTEDDTYIAYNRYRDDFGSDEISYIVYEAPDRAEGPFDLEVMRRIAQLTEAIEDEVPFVKEVTSLTNVEYLEGVADGLEIYDLLEEFPDDAAGMRDVRTKVLAEPLYLNGLITPDGRYGAVIVEMDVSSMDSIETLKLDPEGGDGLDNLYPQVSNTALEDILGRPEYAGIVFHHVGDVPLNAIYNEIIASESDRLGRACFAAIAVLLFVFFRRLMGVLAPLAVVGLSVLVAIGFAGLMGWALDLMFIMLPTLLIAVGVADAVHVISEFRANHAELGDRREAARHTLRLVGTPCLLTSLTTAAGFAAMSIAPIKSISHFAIYAAVGVVAAFVLSVTLLFVLLSLGPRHPKRELNEVEIARAKGGKLVLGWLEAVARFDLRRRREIIAVFGVVFAISALGITRLTVDSNFMSEFSEDEPIRQETLFVDEIMGGTLSLVYLFDSGEPEGVKSPAVLHEIDGLQALASEHELVNKSYTLGDVLKDLNQAFHAEDPTFYTLPESRNLVAQYLLLYETSGGEELQNYVSGDFSTASLELRSKTVETSRLRDLTESIDAHLEENPLEASTLRLTGVGALWLVLQEYLTTSQIQGFMLAFAVIAALLCIIFQSIKTGLLAMVPNLTPVVLTLGAMGWLDVPLDYIRLMLATVAIGISVDDTIHHMTRFRVEFQRTGSYEEALRNSFLDVGRALFITSAVLVLGFLVFRFSTLDTLVIFGSLLATTIGVALLADFLLMPALVLTFRPFGPEAGHKAAADSPSAGVAEALAD